MVKRFVCAFLSVLILSANMSVFASGASSDYETGNLTHLQTAGGQVDGYVGFSAFAAACGVYFKSVGNSWDDYTASIDTMWSNYASNTAGVASSIVGLTASVLDTGLVLTRDVANTYIAFIDFIRTVLGLTDNQSDVSFGGTSDYPFIIPVIRSSAEPLADNFVSIGYGRASNSQSYYNYYVAANSLIDDLSLSFYYKGLNSSNTSYGIYIFNNSDYKMTGNNYATNAYISFGLKNSYSRVWLNANASSSVRLSNLVFTSDGFISGVPVVPYNSQPSFPEPVTGSASLDTAILAIPAPIPDTATGSDALLGVAMPAISSYYDNFAEEVKDMILAGEMDKISSQIAPVYVSPDVVIDDNGNVLPAEINVGLPDVPVLPEKYKTEGLANVFPFSIIFALPAVLGALNTEPVTPEFSADLNFYGVSIPVAFDLHVMDDLMVIVRSGELLIFCVGVLIFIWRKLG